MHFFQLYVKKKKIYSTNLSVEISCHRIRKGFPSEARVVARILPQFLDDFFPLQDVMNKVIGEFLSNQQPYPQFMATVVYKASATFWAQTFFDILMLWVLCDLKCVGFCEFLRVK